MGERYSNNEDAAEVDSNQRAAQVPGRRNKLCLLIQLGNVRPSHNNRKGEVFPVCSLFTALAEVSGCVITVSNGLFLCHSLFHRCQQREDQDKNQRTHGLLSPSSNGIHWGKIHQGMGDYEEGLNSSKFYLPLC